MVGGTNLEHLAYRLDRLYKSLGEVGQAPVEQFAPVVCRSEKFIALHQDFRGGLSEADVRELLGKLLFHDAHVKDLLKKVLREQKRDANVVEQAINASRELGICIDLANWDKHGYPPDRPTRSGLAPRLGDVGRVLRLETGGEPGSLTALTIDRMTGKPVVIQRGGGRAAVVFCGDVLDKNDRKVADIIDIASKAVAAWETLFATLGFSTHTRSSGRREDTQRDY